MNKIKGLSKKIIIDISTQKSEPEWMLERRLQSFEFFKDKSMPTFGPDLSALHFDDLYYYVKPCQGCQARDIREYGLKEGEDKYLAGFGAQCESEIVYHNLKKEWESKGVLFLGTDRALQKYPELFKKHFGTVVPFDDNKFAALNTAVWSGGSFIYVPKGVHIKVPLQAYYRIDTKKLGQFERTLIIAEQGSSVTYIEGCGATNNENISLHSAVVEIIAKKGARVRYYTIQNWSHDVYNLVTKRAVAHEGAVIEWIDGNIGSGITMKYPAVVLQGKNAKTDILSLAIAGKGGQIQDSGAKVMHLASQTSSNVISKSLCSSGGRASFRSLVKVAMDAKYCKSFVQCDSLLMDNLSRADSYPYIDVKERSTNFGYEARVSSIEEDKLFYLMSRGIFYEEAQNLVINGFIEPFVKQLPFEYAIEINRLIDMHIGGNDAK
jgi:Fe-S cluster assembly protein SufB